MDLLPQVDPELAYRLATQPAYPGWGFMVANGANTMWETWDGSASRNHPPFCLISGYFYKYLAGIRCVSEYPGFKRFVIDPSVVGDLTFVEAWHDSMYGRIESGWKRDGERLTLDVTVRSIRRRSFTCRLRRRKGSPNRAVRRRRPRAFGSCGWRTARRCTKWFRALIVFKVLFK